MPTDRLYDRLPFEIANVLSTVERWYDNECDGRTACADADLTLLADAAKALAEWKDRQPQANRVTLDGTIHHDTDTHRLFKERPRFTDKDRPKLRIVPRPWDDETKE